MNCPNCGAASLSGRCKYCGTLLESVQRSRMDSSDEQIESEIQSVEKQIQYWKSSGAPKEIVTKKLTEMQNRLKELRGDK